MLKAVLLVAPLALVASFSAASVKGGGVEDDTLGIDGARRAELLYVMEQDCGSCHGLTLRGGLGPSLHPELLADRNAAELAETILDGVPGTPMPPWRPLLEPKEALWMAKILKSGVLAK